jgi:tetratricopeptide (TPR) repeat protein
MALNNLSVVANMQGDYAAMQRYLEESLEIYRELHIPLGIAATLLNLGVVASKQEDYKTAQRFYEESVILSKQLGHKLYLSHSIHNLADVMLRLNEIDKALVYLRESVELGRDLGNTAHLLLALERFATVAVRQERYAAAVRWLSAATLAREQMGFSRAPANVHDCVHDQNLALSKMPGEAFATAWQQGQEMTLEMAFAEALQK